MKCNMTTTENLKDLIEMSDSGEVKRISEIFLAAMNDWPDDIQTVEEFIQAISIDFSGLMHKDVENFSKTFEAGSSAWKLEASAILLDLWNGRDKSQSIQDIASELRAYRASK